MSATIYALPKEFESTIPNIFQNYEEYQVLEKAWIETVRQFCLENNDSPYVGEVLRFPVADGEALYMVASLSPKVELIVLPLMDAYEFQYVHLMTAKEVKSQINKAIEWDAFNATQCNVGEVNEFLAEFADEVYDMPDHALELIMDDHICVKWSNPTTRDGEKEYFVKKDNSFYGEQGEKVYNYLHKSFLV